MLKGSGDQTCCVEGYDGRVVGGYELFAKGLCRKTSGCAVHMPMALETMTRSSN
jgi:hypothetical protein